MALKALICINEAMKITELMMCFLYSSPRTQVGFFIVVFVCLLFFFKSRSGSTNCNPGPEEMERVESPRLC